MAFHFNNFHHQALGLEINGIPYNSFFSLPHQPCRLDLFIAAFVTVCCFAFSFSMRLFGTQVEKHKVSGELHFFPSILFHISSFSFSACLYSAVKLPSNLHMVAIVTTYPPSLCAWMCVCVRKFWIQNMSMWTCVCKRPQQKYYFSNMSHLSTHTHMRRHTHTHEEVIPVSTKKESLYLSAFISSPVFIHGATPSLLP